MRAVMWSAAGGLVLAWLLLFSFVFDVGWFQGDGGTVDPGIKIWDASDGKPEPGR